ncbi:MAG: kelch repeat-containing protein, partial [Bacteroidia bacterium]
MKKLYFLLIFSVFFVKVNAQPGVWTCIKPNTGIGNFGILGIPDSANTPPPLINPTSWTDLQGNFWIFGGVNSYFFPVQSWGDLWKYESANNMWTWIKGSGTLGDPGVLGTMGVVDSISRPSSNTSKDAWIDINGDFWLFNGKMWKYNITSNTWTWMSGGGNVSWGTKGISSPNNTPGARQHFTAWTDSQGNFWLFGGRLASDSFNDLWMYSIITNEWTWINGTNTPEHTGSYGILGQPDSTNLPSSRRSPTSWIDHNERFWLFGGVQSGQGNSTYCNLNYNDMWMFDPITHIWTWMGGSSSINSNGNYESTCLSSSIYTPSARYGAQGNWTDNNGNLWLYGGGYVDGYCYGMKRHNDLWTFNPMTQEWSLKDGNFNTNQMHLINNVGVPSLANQPGARLGSVGWKNNSGEFYLFGGGIWNELWKYSINPNGCDTNYNISGKIYFDSNNNCAYDNNESKLRNVKVLVY